MSAGYQPLDNPGRIAPPPLNPGRASIVEHARRLELRDSDVVCLPADTTHEQALEFVAALGPDGLNIRCLIVLGDVHALDEAAMNAAGWYRK